MNKIDTHLPIYSETAEKGPPKERPSLYKRHMQLLLLKPLGPSSSVPFQVKLRLFVPIPIENTLSCYVLLSSCVSLADLSSLFKSSLLHHCSHVFLPVLEDLNQRPRSSSSSSSAGSGRWGGAGARGGARGTRGGGEGERSGERGGRRVCRLRGEV